MKSTLQWIWCFWCNYIQFHALSLHRQPNQCFTHAAHQFLPLLGVQIRSILFFSNERNQWFLFFFFLLSFYGMKHCSKEQEKWSGLFLCGGENQGHISKCLPCPKAPCAFLFTHVNGDSKEPFVSQKHKLFQLCVELGLCVTVHWGLRKHQRCYPIP